MLFELRGKRKRVLQVAYALLAVAFVVGFLVFFIGSDGSGAGNIFDLFKGGGGQSSTFEDQEEKLEKQIKANPKNESLYPTLIRTEWSIATSPENLDQQTGQPNSGGTAALRKLTQTWQNYLALDPKKVSAQAATYAARGYQQLGQWEQAAQAQAIVAEKQPSANAYYALAMFAFFANDNREAELAGKKAVELAPKDERKRLRSQITRVKEAAAKQQAEELAQQSQGSSSPLGVP